MKVCKRCKVEKDSNDFWGREGKCKECKNEKRRELKRQNTEKYYAKSYIQEKNCIKCGKTHKRKCYTTCSLKCLILTYIRKNKGCWEWTGSLNEHNYGKLAIRRKTFFAHRLSYQEFIGEIPKGMCLLHKCDNSKCVNPKHLRLGTRSDNAKEMYAKKRNNCQRGEERFCAKLKEKNIHEIREMIKRGISKVEIARRFKVHNSTISNINQRKTWAHI